MLRRYGWHVELSDNAGARTAFNAQVRQRRREGWAYLRHGGWRHLREGYWTGPFGNATASPWRSDLIITGTFHGRTFLASQIWRYELRTGERSQTNARRRALLELHAVPAPCDAEAALPRFEARTGLLTGRVRGAPPGLEALLRSDGATLFVAAGYWPGSRTSARWRTGWVRASETPTGRHRPPMTCQAPAAAAQRAVLRLARGAAKPWNR